MLFNVLSFLIVGYICMYYCLIRAFILVFIRLFPLFSFFFAEKLRYICTCVRIYEKLFNKSL